MEYGIETESVTQADDVVRGIYSLFTDTDSPVWKQAQEVLATEEEKITWLGEKLAYAEGKQENLYESITIVEAALEEIKVSHAQSIEALELQPAFLSLYECSMLNSDSVFASLQEQTEEMAVTPEMAEEETEKLIGELKTLFEGRSRMFRRAIMAVTVEKLPILFTSGQEVADYIMNSLNQCNDAAEKFASKQLIWDWTH
ncbi:MAG: hypothetical protein K2J67_11835, partial [Lachnospiraceae bacterium]|nr:hypothetical protein [Lachnospiraceae bacterium]